MTKITESAIDKFAIELLQKQGYGHIYAPDLILELFTRACAPAPSEARQASAQAGNETFERLSFEDGLHIYHFVLI